MQWLFLNCLVVLNHHNGLLIIQIKIIHVKTRLKLIQLKAINLIVKQTYQWLRIPRKLGEKFVDLKFVDLKFVDHYQYMQYMRWALKIIKIKFWNITFFNTLKWKNSWCASSNLFLFAWINFSSLGMFHISFSYVHKSIALLSDWREFQWNKKLK